MDRHNLYDHATLDAVRARIESLKPDSQPAWGKMTSAQMLAHCAEVQEVANGKPLSNSPWYVKLFKGMIRRMVLSDRPYPRSSATHPQYLMSEQKEFGEQRDRLLAALQAMHDAGAERAEEVVHPLFGRLSADEKGWAMYKHLDHHLTQFGV